MPAAPSPKTNTDAALESLARDLVDAEVELAKKAGDIIARIETLKGAMREACPKGGKFKWTFAKKGEVELAGAADGKLKGVFPEVDVEAYLALSEARRKKLAEDGIVAMVPQRGKPFYGRVTVKLFDK